MQYKKTFVDNYLKPLVLGMRIGVKDVQYFHHENGEEVVVITYVDGYKTERCVTADSLLALSRDTLKGL